MKQGSGRFRNIRPWCVLGLALSLAVLASACRQKAATPKSSELRIVSLAPSLTEMICAIDGTNKLVGRTSVCNYPPDVENVPIIGEFGKPSMELLLATEPSLIVDVALSDESIGRKIALLGLKRERIPCDRLNDIPVAMLTLGRLMGCEAKAQRIAEPMWNEVARQRELNNSYTNRPRVFIEVWNDPLTTAGTNSFLSEMVELAGGSNIGDELENEYYQVSPEWVLSRDPQVILCFYMTTNSQPTVLTLNRDGWQNVNAVRNNRVFSGFNNDIMLRPGPRALEGLHALRSAIDTAREESSKRNRD